MTLFAPHTPAPALSPTAMSEPMPQLLSDYLDTEGVSMGTFIVFWMVV